jgi:Zn-dependent peptidase ImmA (M78 family)
MYSAERNYINQIASRLISALHIEIPIISLEGVVSRLGGEIVEKKALVDVHDGTIKKTSENSFEIVISPYQSEERRKFTIAHELGHLFLHMGYLLDSDLWSGQDDKIYKYFGTAEEEYQANVFASALLMPREEFEKTVSELAEGSRVDVQQVADYFMVSVSAAKNRGYFLGLFC